MPSGCCTAVRARPDQDGRRMLLTRVEHFVQACPPDRRKCRTGQENDNKNNERLQKAVGVRCGFINVSWHHGEYEYSRRRLLRQPDGRGTGVPGPTRAPLLPDLRRSGGLEPVFASSQPDRAIFNASGTTSRLCFILSELAGYCWLARHIRSLLASSTSLTR